MKSNFIFFKFGVFNNCYILFVVLVVEIDFEWWIVAMNNFCFLVDVLKVRLKCDFLLVLEFVNFELDLVC